MLSKLKSRYYWPGHYNDVYNWCLSCSNCATRKNPTQHSKAPMSNITVGNPLQMVAVDIVGPFPTSANHNSYILVAADYFTKWSEAYPIPNQEATRVLVNEFFSDFHATPL